MAHQERPRVHVVLRDEHAGPSTAGVYRDRGRAERAGAAYALRRIRLLLRRFPDDPALQRAYGRMRVGLERQSPCVVITEWNRLGDEGNEEYVHVVAETIRDG